MSGGGAELVIWTASNNWVCMAIFLRSAQESWFFDMRCHFGVQTEVNRISWSKS